MKLHKYNRPSVAFVLPDAGCSVAVAVDGWVAPLPNLNPPVPNEKPETGFVPKPPENVEVAPSGAAVVDVDVDEAEKLNSGDGCVAGALLMVELTVKKPGLA